MLEVFLLGTQSFFQQKNRPISLFGTHSAEIALTDRNITKKKFFAKVFFVLFKNVGFFVKKEKI